jgi:hypothetical protein
MLTTLSKQATSLQEYTSGQYQVSMAASAGVSPEVARRIAGRRYVTLVDLELTERILRLPEAAAAHVMTVYARDLKRDDMGHSNLILVGARAINPWVELYWNDLDFVVERNYATGEDTILNRRPRNGEQESYFYQPQDTNRAVYCALSFDVGKNGNGSVLILQGTTMAGVQACTDYMMDDARWDDLITRVRAGGELRSFEVLLRTHGTVDNPTRPVVLAMHVH